MILSGIEIQKRLDTDIYIDPFNPNQLNPNSYNLKLYNELLIYENALGEQHLNNVIEWYRRIQ